MKKSIAIALACGALSLFAAQAGATTMSYTDRASFEATLGTQITDGYDTATYGTPLQILTKAQMDAAFGETTYESTFFNVPNHNLIQGSAADPNYCAGCNGSFRLTFTTTSVGDANGVFGVGFDIESHAFASGVPYSAFVTFGDLSTQDFVFPAGESFFGITDDMNAIRSIHIALSNTTTDSGTITIDNLTIGAAAQRLPEPGALAIFGLGLAGLAVARRRR